MFTTQYLDQKYQREREQDKDRTYSRLILLKVLDSPLIFFEEREQESKILKHVSG
jgi:hypothetical protein